MRTPASTCRSYETLRRASVRECGRGDSARDTRRSRMRTLTKITERVYWMPPGPPDRPSLCAVVGDRRTVMLDAGSSPAHTRTFLDALFAASGARPAAVLYSHSHWDHVLGGAELGGMVIAHALTAERLTELAARDWSDEGLDRRVAADFRPRTRCTCQGGAAIAANGRGRPGRHRLPRSDRARPRRCGSPRSSRGRRSQRGRLRDVRRAGPGSLPRRLHLRLPEGVMTPSRPRGCAT